MTFFRTLTVFALGSLLAVAATKAADAPKPPSVFDLPMVSASQQAVTLLVCPRGIRKSRAAARACRQGDAAGLQRPLQPGLCIGPAGQDGRLAGAAWKSRSNSVSPTPSTLETDDDLAKLRELPRFKAALKKARENVPAGTRGWKYTAEPAEFKDGQYLVSEKNTVYDPRLGLFASVFKIDKKATADKPIVEGYGKAGDLLKQWYKEGTAAGNHGDLYDNRDHGHSFMNFKSFPQLARVIYDDETQKRQLHWGLQRLFMYNGICIGNSSTALTSSPAWRCQGRLALTEPGVPLLLYLQYVGNHLYVYPVHVDNNPGHNGAGARGTATSCRQIRPTWCSPKVRRAPIVVFLDAFVAALAALRPEVKRDLAASGTLMPALQMIFRTSNRQVAKPEDYLTGKAHPTAFEGSQVDAEKMVTLAHDIKPEVLPPMVQLKVLEEDQGVVGRDYFDVGPRERLFDTPCAIARIVKSTKYEHRMVVSAEGSKDMRKQAADLPLGRPAGRRDPHPHQQAQRGRIEGRVDRPLSRAPSDRAGKRARVEPRRHRRLRP